MLNLRAPETLAPVRETRFGIEIEFIGLGGAYRAGDTLVEHGFNAVSESYNHSTRSHWKVVEDGSVGYRGGELVSPPLPFNVKSLSEVQAAYIALKDAGGTMNDDCGLHVHVDATYARSYDTAKRNAFFAFVLAAYQSVESTFLGCVKENRRNGSYSRTVSGRTVSEVMDNRYHALNLSAYHAHGTIEFRSLQGTLNENAVIAWITLCVTFMDNVRDRFEASYTASNPYQGARY